MKDISLVTLANIRAINAWRKLVEAMGQKVIEPKDWGIEHPVGNTQVTVKYRRKGDAPERAVTLSEHEGEFPSEILLTKLRMLLP